MLARMAPTMRPATLDDLPALTAIYNHYVINTTITFDLEPFAPESRRSWFDAHAASGRHRLLIAADPDNTVLGYATTSRWRPKAAYDTTVESSVYCRPDVVGRGVGTALYSALFETLASEGVHRVVAGVSQPNPASVALHQDLASGRSACSRSVGLKFGSY